MSAEPIAHIEVTDDLEACLALRRTVFIQEQGVSEADEHDGRDGAAVHFLARLGHMPVGTARMFLSGQSAKIGRVCVLRDWRGRGLGAGLITSAIAYCKDDPDICMVTLGAQVTAIPFYERLGFEARGPEFLDAGILHREMVLSL